MVEEIHRRIAALGIGERVTVMDAIVDVNQVLASVHAAAIFAATPGILKSYPHSLLDALAAGKPVLLSNILALSYYVNKKQCGVVVEKVTPEAIVAALAQLRAGYATYAHNAESVGRRDFSEEAALSAARTIYAAALKTDKLP
jgi:glycosyltransferase involved in cell wall biosynthesis